MGVVPGTLLLFDADFRLLAMCVAIVHADRGTVLVAGNILFTPFRPFTQ